MFTAIKVNAGHAPNGSGLRAGWVVYHIRPAVLGSGNDYQPTPLGFIDYQREPNWSTIRRSLPGIQCLGDLDITADEYDRLIHPSRIATPEHMRGVADAIEGN